MTVTGTSPSSARPLCSIDGQIINVDTMTTAVAVATERLRQGLGFTFFTLNLDHLCKRRQSPAFREVYQRATFVSADGAPIAKLARSVGADVKRTTGADMVLPMIEVAAREGFPIYLFGTSDEVLAASAERLKARYPNLVIAGTHSPAMGFQPNSTLAEEAADRIAASGARMCFVALGAPKQELFSDMLLARHPQIGLFCIGAALDFIAGRQKRAPGILANTGLEWLWRLSQEPKRMARRYAENALLLADLLLPWRYPHLVTKAMSPAASIPPDASPADGAANSETLAKTGETPSGTDLPRVATANP